MSGESCGDDDDDFQFEAAHAGSKRYPVHDCCEFEDADALRRLIFIPQDASDDDDDDDDDDDGDSSSDDNDSIAAARAAAIGHSPKPINATVSDVSADSANHAGLHISLTGEEGSERGPLDGGATKSNSTTNATTEATNGDASQSTGEAPAAAAEKPEEERADAAGAPSQEDPKAEKPGETAEQEPPQGDDGAADAMDVDPAERSANGESPRANDEEPKKKVKSISYYCPHDLNERDEDENTPLHVAIHACKLEHVKLLLEAGASHARKCDGSFPVQTAISMGAIPQHADFARDCVALLVSHGADLNLKDESMHTPLYLASMMNLPRVVSFILSDSEGMSTLNVRADRFGGRPLHAAAKFDLQSSPNNARRASTAGRPTAQNHHHHPDGTISHSTRHIPGIAAEGEAQKTVPQHAQDPAVHSPASVTELLLSQTGIEVDGANTLGHTALHVACARGNWPVARLLLKAKASATTVDRRGFTPCHMAHKRGMLIPNDLVELLGDRPSDITILAPPRDLIVDPDSSTFLISHELCMLHRSCPPIRRDGAMDPPPENIRRLHVLVNSTDGILRSGEFSQMAWQDQARRAAISDVLKCHEYEYVEKISRMCSSIPDCPSSISHLDADTAVSRWSFEAAMRAAGSVCEAVDRVINGDHRNAFCAVRPPGHHAGPRGIVRCANDPEGGSHGFCLLNNVAIGAAYARSMYRNDGIEKIAIIDFDVHHGNGTEEILRQLVPTVERAVVRAPFAVGELQSQRYCPWLDETDIDNVFFASTHGYGPRGVDFDLPQQPGWFYPASGRTHVSDAIASPAMVEKPSLGDFLLSQTWTRMGEDAKLNCCKIINAGLGLPDREAVPGMQRLELRDTYRKNILPRLREFDPDIIFISAGFDAHKKDTMNFGYVGMVEDDYEWVTEQLVKVANSCCQGRVVSVLEGGYKVHGGIVSPFARSVAAHVRGLVDGGHSRELYDQSDVTWESQHERQILEDRERKRQLKLERQQRAMEAVRIRQSASHDEDAGEPLRKRRRNQVDYKQLYEDMKREGIAS